MGHDLSIARLAERETYHLGEPVMGYEGEAPETDMPRGAYPRDPRARAAWVNAMQRASKRAWERENGMVSPIHELRTMWSEAHRHSHRTFQLTEMDRDLLADALHKGGQSIRNRYQADIVAREIIGWAGHSHLMLVVDGDLSPIRALGIGPGSFQQTGSIADTLGEQLMDHGATPGGAWRTGT